MITIYDVLGKYKNHPDVTQEVTENISKLVTTVNALMKYMEAEGVVFHVNPITGTYVGGETLGGFRPKSCPIGADKSAHKRGLAVDLYDKTDEIDAWLMAHASILNQFGLYFEHPKATPRWSHWTVRAPGSKRRFFYP